MWSASQRTYTTNFLTSSPLALCLVKKYTSEHLLGVFSWSWVASCVTLSTTASSNASCCPTPVEEQHSS